RYVNRNTPRASQKDPGLTSEMALFTTFCLGALCMTQPALAAGLAVTISILLASRTGLHRFVRHVLTAQEAQDALLFGAAALVILPLAPNRAVDPFGVLNPRTLWRLVVVVMAISAAGYISLRVLGPRYGLPISGLRRASFPAPRRSVRWETERSANLQC